MGLSVKHLNENEEIVLDLHPHWWYLAKYTLALVAAMVLVGVVLGTIDSNGVQWYVDPSRYASGALLLVALIAFGVRLIMWKNIDFVVTNERCIYRAGVVAKNGIEIPLDRINTVFFNQSVFERNIGAGDLGIESAGENSRQEFSDIARPSSVQKTIYAEMEGYESRRQDRLGSVMAQAQGTHAAPATSAADELAKLGELLSQGLLTQAEFDAQKARLLG